MITFTVQNKVISFTAVQPKPVSITTGGSRVSFQVNTGSVNINILQTETLIGAIDNVNKVFTTTDNFKANSSQVFINGLRQKLGTHYVESGANEITFSDAPSNVGYQDELIINYIKE